MLRDKSNRIRLQVFVIMGIAFVVAVLLFVTLYFYPLAVMKKQGRSFSSVMGVQSDNRREYLLDFGSYLETNTNGRACLLSTPSLTVDSSEGSVVTISLSGVDNFDEANSLVGLIEEYLNEEDGCFLEDGSFVDIQMYSDYIFGEDNQAFFEARIIYLSSGSEVTNIIINSSENLSAIEQIYPNAEIVIQ